MFQQLDQIAQIEQGIAPTRCLGGLSIKAVGRVLVAPMGRDALFGDPVHRFSADLHLDAHALWPHHRGVERAIVIALGCRDIVLEPLGNRRPSPMDDAKRPIAIILIINNDPEGIDVRQLGKANRFALKLTPDRERVLFAAKDTGGNSSRLELLSNFLAYHRHRWTLGLTQGFQTHNNGVAGHGIEMLESQLFKLGTEPVAADGAGQGGVDVEGLTRDPLTLLGLGDIAEGAHIVQTVGQLDHQDPHILGNGQDELAKIFRLTCLL